MIYNGDNTRCTGHLPDEDERNETKDEVTPLVAGVHERTDQPCDDDEDTHEHRRQDVREREAGCEQAG